MKIKFNLILTLAAMLTMAQTAWATDPVTKTYAFSTMTTSNGNTISANDPEDNNSSKAIIIAQDGNSKISKVDFLNYIQIANMSGVGGTGADAEFLIYPHINGKVTQIVFTNVSRPSLLGSESFSMSIAGMKYNGTDDALTGVSSSQSTATFTSTNSEGISGNLTMTLSAYSQLQLNSGSEIRITYIPAMEAPHQHNFTFNVSGNTLTATCAHNDGKECSLAGDGYKATLTLTADGGHYYPEVNYSASHDLGTFNAKTGLSATAGDITITNQDTSESTTGSVHDVGRYTATLTVTIDDTDYELRKGFSIHMGIITCDYPQFSFSPATPSEGDEVTITFTPQWGDESIQTFTMRGVEGNMGIGSGITDKGDGTYTFTMPDGALFVEATFTTPSAAHFAQDGDTYTIKSDGGWRYFCKLIKEDEAPDGFSGKTVKLATSVGSSEMAGTSGHPFKGTFDGQNHTLTFNRTAAEHLSAPFHNINGATISNFHVEGTITGGTYESLGGLVGRAEGNITIENCHVSTEISTTVSGSALHGGVIALWNSTNATCTVTGCVYDGLIYNPNEAGVTTSCHGFIGWDYGNNGTIKFTDCLFAPAAYGTDKYALGDNCFTFVYPNSEPTLTYNMTNCYYTSILGKRQGRPAATATTAPGNLGNATTDHGMVDGYENGFLYDGNYYTPKYGDAVVEYRFNDWIERADVTINGTNNQETGVNVVGVNITDEVGNIKSVTYNRPFNTAQAATVILPFSYICDGDEGGKFYSFAGFNGTTPIMEDGNQVTSLTANTPYLFMPSETKMTFPNITSMTGGVVTLQTTTGDHEVTSDDGNWTFVGSYSIKTWAIDDPEIIKAYFINDEGKLEKIVSEMTTIPTSCNLLREVESLTLYDSGSDAEDNTSAIAAAAASSNTYDVTLSDRTLYKDGKWNTLCLPFSLNAEQIAANADFAGATLMTMDVTEKNGFDATDGTLYLWFKTATAIEAGVPYLVKWDKAADYDNNPSVYDIVSPVFEGVTVSNSTAQIVESKTAGLETVQMVGTYSPVGVTADDKSILFLGDANTLYYSTVDRQIRSCRAYFSVPYINGHAGAKARAFALSFVGEETTGILEVSANSNEVKDDVWYSLDGVRLNGKPIQRGMYINKGKKIVVK